ncbi:unnamed protein product [Acanthoscelides obtectus]|uniref:Uncharacterized protein n=1 Tax=Acanthoscelides obtectus TaxID=200917 RepID=A0A9P0KGZ1_ACAOB|nr:unnamed protein product [Acanthoscelides obtectus]CAK1666647.1 General odorant-binding protein 56d [Acanthoscelides obtectus]
MKVYAVLVVIGAIFGDCCSQKYTEQEKAVVIKNRDECIVETKVNPALLEKADKGLFVDDPKLHCFIKCFYQKTGFVTESGEPILSNIRNRLPASMDKDRAIELVKKCQQSRKGRNPCENVYLIHKCYYENTVPDDGQATKKTG